MIQVNQKNFNNVPVSLNKKTTQDRRNEVIAASKYINEKKYNTRYKTKDIKDALALLYQKKCAFCEQYAERWDVEHYRPKSIYFWLAYSWDNLLFSCQTCNQNYKKDKFDVLENRVTYQATELNTIHTLCASYNNLEKPKLLHPEFDDPEALWTFDEKGIMDSEDVRGQYTIETCGLSRKELNDKRKEIIDDLKRDLEDTIILSSGNPAKLISGIEVLIKQFANNSYDSKNNFLAFRRFVLKNLLNDIVGSSVSN